VNWQIKILDNQDLLKYGHSRFSLEILEYCSKDILLERENFYLSLLKPKYNILKYAYSMLGFKHSAESIAKLKLKKLTQEQKQLLSLVNKVVSQETKNKLSSSTTDFRKSFIFWTIKSFKNFKD
jgi:group I intron endonuclease